MKENNLPCGNCDLKGKCEYENKLILIDYPIVFEIAIVCTIKPSHTKKYKSK